MQYNTHISQLVSVENELEIDGDVGRISMKVKETKQHFIATEAVEYWIDDEDMEGESSVELDYAMRCVCQQSGTSPQFNEGKFYSVCREDGIKKPLVWMEGDAMKALQVTN